MIVWYTRISILPNISFSINKILRFTILRHIPVKQNIRSMPHDVKLVWILRKLKFEHETQPNMKTGKHENCLVFTKY